MASFEHSSLQVRVDRVDRVYRPGEVVAGTVVARVRKGWRHQGVGLRALGAVEIAHHLRPFMNEASVVTPPGHFSDGEHALRFEMELRPCEGSELLESYHGSANITYMLICTCRRGPLRPALEARCEIFVEVPGPGPPPEPAPTTFTLTREKGLRVSGKVDTRRCSLARPFTGELRVDECAVRIRSIDIALMRRETVSGVLGRAAEVRRTQIVDGDVARGIDIPIHVFFPRLFACPSLAIDGLSVAFEVDVVVCFGEGLIARESIPLVLYR